MACDLATQRRRIKWEYLNKENAPCKAQFGFLLDGSLCRQYWFAMDEVQTDPDWTWLNAGFVLDNREPLNPRFTGEWVWTGDNPAFEIALDIQGTNDPADLGPPGEGITMRLENSILRPVGINPGFFVSVRQFTPQPNNSVWSFGDWVDVLGTGLSLPQGDATVTPLQACNDCQTGSGAP